MTREDSTLTTEVGRKRTWGRSAKKKKRDYRAVGVCWQAAGFGVCRMLSFDLNAVLTVMPLVCVWFVVPRLDLVCELG